MVHENGGGDLMLPAFLILAFTFTDTATTLFGVHLLGATELNPMYAILSPAGFWSVKWTIAGLSAFAAGKWWDVMPVQFRWALWAGAVIPAAASMSNAVNMLVWSYGWGG